MNQEANFLVNQGSIDRLQKMLDKEIAKRIRDKMAVDTPELYQRACVTVPMNVWKGTLFGELHCSVNTVGAIEQGIL
jgi:hypothetical protein